MEAGSRPGGRSGQLRQAVLPSQWQGRTPQLAQYQIFELDEGKHPPLGALDTYLIEVTTQSPGSKPHGIQTTLPVFRSH